MATFPTDQFDNLPDSTERIGAHRGPRVRGRGWITFAWAVLATAVIVVGGLYVLSVYDPSVKLNFGGSATSTGTATPTGTPVPTITPITNPKSIASRKITVTVLNGTATVGLQNQAAAKLKAVGWVINGVADSTATNIKTTTVYYSNSTNEDVAQGIEAALGAGSIEFSSAFPGSPITVVVGSDFTK